MCASPQAFLSHASIFAPWFMLDFLSWASRSFGWFFGSYSAIKLNFLFICFLISGKSFFFLPAPFPWEFISHLPESLTVRRMLKNFHLNLHTQFPAVTDSIHTSGDCSLTSLRWLSPDVCAVATSFLLRCPIFLFPYGFFSNALYFFGCKVHIY